MTSSHHAPYVLGYTRATLAGTKGCKPVRGSESQKVGPGSDWRLKLASMKAELLVIADQQRRVREEGLRVVNRFQQGRRRAGL